MKKKTKQLIAEAKELLEDIRKDLHRRIRFGGMLEQLYQELEHGEWEHTVTAVFKLSKKSIFNFRDLYLNRDLIEPVLEKDPDLTQAAALKICQDARRVPKKKTRTAQQYLLFASRSLWSRTDLTDDERTKRQANILKFYRRFRGHAGRRPGPGCVASHFLDSGSYSLQKDALHYATRKKCDTLDYYSTPDFYEYRDNYAEFVKRYAKAIDLYANIDVIGNPELTWKNQQYLEHVHQCQPVPVVHYGTDGELKWLKHYIEKGYELIGLGGLVGSTTTTACREWITKCFALAEQHPVKLHGFGICSHELLTGFKWHSVDSTGWLQAAQYCNIYVPRWKDGDFDLSQPPRIVYIAEREDEPQQKDVIIEEPDKLEPQKPSKYYRDMTEEERQVVQWWLNTINIPLGEKRTVRRRGPNVDTGETEETETIEFRKGVTNYYEIRRQANLHYFEHLAKHLNETTLYYSGSGSRVTSPEITLGDNANIMLTYYELNGYWKKGVVPARFNRIYKARRRGKQTYTSVSSSRS